MMLDYFLPAIIGLFGGAISAAGFFAFITAIGLITTYAYRTHTAKYIHWYENAVIIGAILGNTWWSLEIVMPLGASFWSGFSGMFYGIFTGSLVVALAETIKAIPIFFRRARITVGLMATLIAFAVGKTIGNLLYTIIYFGNGG